MTVSTGGLLLGLLVGLRHAFEPDHLTAVSTLVTEVAGARRGAWLGAIWGLGHTLALVVVGALLMVIGASLPATIAAAFECAVSAMLVILGLRSIVRAAREGATGPVATHRHGGVAHVHPSSSPHVHVAGRALSWRPLVVGIVHGLAGSGALTALVFAELPGTASRIAYITLFGAGSVAGMTIVSGIAGASLRAVASGRRARQSLSFATGALSIIVGIAWAIPMMHVLAA